MSRGADVKSLEAIHHFRAAVLNFQEEARLCLQSLESQLLKFLSWIERERPGFWKREIELCYRQHGEARVSYHRCRMRKMGDFKPTCFEERKAMEAAKKALEFAQKQIPVVKHWISATQHEANEYKGRSSQISQFIERDIPELLALLTHSILKLEEYAEIAMPGNSDGPVGSASFVHQESASGEQAADAESDSSDASLEGESPDAGMEGTQPPPSGFTGTEGETSL